MKRNEATAKESGNAERRNPVFKRKKAALLITALCSFGLIVGLTACAPQSGSKATPESAAKPEADSFGVIVADEWATLYPNQYASFKANEEDSPDAAITHNYTDETGKLNYLSYYPALNTLYKGYAFSLDYEEPAGHPYTLESVSETKRTTEKQQLANCITCKTPQFTAQVNSEGDGIYALSFNDLIGTYTEPISCYNCHLNDPQNVTYANAFYTNSLGSSAKTVSANSAACGQCHNEYYFDPTTKVTTNPYSGLAAMTPVAIVDYYDGIGFKDWEHPVTGAAMLKCQHPEFEMVYGGTTPSHMAELGYTCADCHMGTATAEDGSTYTSHHLVSPLKNQTLLNNNCIACHEDLAAEVTAIQEASEARVQAISQKLEQYINLVGAQKDAGTLTGEKLAQAQQIHREAQFYWDFVMNENSEGAHNPTTANATLDRAEALIDQGLALVQS